jgi:hypothetical protein
MESVGRLDVGAWKGARQIQAIQGKRVQVFPIIEIEVEHGAVVLARSDQDGGLAPEQKVVGVIGVQRQRLGVGGHDPYDQECARVAKSE